MEPNENSQNTVQPESQSGNQNSDNGSDRTLTRDQVDQILRGQGKELERLKNENEALKKADNERIANVEKQKQKKLTEQGEFKSLYEQEKTKNETMSNQLTEMIKQRETRLKIVNQNNEKRLKALPKDLQMLVHPSLGIEEKSDQLTNLESMLKQDKVKIHGGTINQETQGPLTLEQKHAKWKLAGARALERAVK